MKLFIPLRSAPRKATPPQWGQEWENNYIGYYKTLIKNHMRLSTKDTIVGERYGRLTVTKCVGTKNRKRQWLCVCDCGNTTIQPTNMLRSKSKKNSVQSCGCLLEEYVSTLKKHGMKGTRTYNAWQSLKGRCTYKKKHGYDRYGGRGITYDKRWEKFENFYEDMGERPSGMQIDRIDNDGNYCKENCRWVTPKINGRNKSDTVHVTYHGLKGKLIDLIEESDIKDTTIRSRLRLGWSIEDALEQKVRRLTKKNR